MADQNVEKLPKESYIKAIENSVGSKLFNSFFVQFKDTGKTVDILNDGMYSCAFFVSSLLYLFRAIDEPHATVKSTRECLDKNPRWQKVDLTDIQTGDVIFWEKITFDDGSKNAHVGFALNKDEAVSTNYKQKMAARHPIIRQETRRAVEDIYRYHWQV